MTGHAVVDMDIREETDWVVDEPISPEILDILLIDRSTSGNIKWATDNYVQLNGEKYDADREILPELILGDNRDIIVPRAKKDILTQKSRTKKKAEVFTPSWIVDKQVSEVLDAFNGLDLDAFLGTTWLEITCGEAPYMANRYDMMTGETIELDARKGFIDRKFQRLNAEVSAQDSLLWLNHAMSIYKASYGYEYQGDSLLLARMNLLLTFIDNYRFVFGDTPSNHTLSGVAQIISWNVLQMDGLKCTVPYSDDVNALVMDWSDWIVLEFRELGKVEDAVGVDE